MPITSVRKEPSVAIFIVRSRPNSFAWVTQFTTSVPAEAIASTSAPLD